MKLRFGSMLVGILVLGCGLMGCRQDESASQAEEAASEEAVATNVPSKGGTSDASEFVAKEGSKSEQGVGAGSADFTGVLPDSWEGRTAMEQIEHLKEEETWMEGKAEFYEEWGKVDPLRALDTARRYEPRSITAATRAVLIGWAEENPQAAMQWVSGQKKTSERGFFVRSVLETVGERDDYSSPAMAEWLEGELEVPGIKNVLTPFMSRWMDEDEEQAMLWVEEKVTEPEVRQHLFLNRAKRVFEQGDESVRALSEEIVSREEGPVRDEMIWAFVKVMAPYGGSETAQWAEMIQDEKLKAEAMSLSKAMQAAEPEEGEEEPTEE